MLSSAEDIEPVMNSFQEGWRAGAVDVSHFTTLNRGGSWGAMMRAEGGNHWVVVDGLNRAKNVLIRDPARASMIEMSQTEFHELWRNIAVWGPMP